MNRLQAYLHRYGTLMVIGLSTLAVAWCVQAGSAGATDLFNQVCTGSGSQSSACNKTNDDIVSRTVGKVTNLVTYISGIVAVIMIMVGGFLYLTANGDASKVADAKNTIVFTLIGVTVVVLSRFIILFVLNRV